LDADLILVGSHTRSGLKRSLLGSVAEKVLRGSTVPVLVVPLFDAGEEHDTVAIEPACTGCLDERRRTQGQELWCARHRGQRDHHNTHHQISNRAGREPNYPLGAWAELRKDFGDA
jgi:hypothetical protein